MNNDMSPAEERLYGNLVKIAFIGSLLIYFWGIWSIPVLSFNEARRMIVVREMLLNGNWLIPTLNAEIYVTKPPFFYWLVLPFSLLFHSTAEWVIRLPSALSSLGITWLLFARMKKYIDRWSALFTVLTLITCWFFIRFARRAEIEMVLTACCAAAVLFYFDYAKGGARKYLYASYLFLALAFLTKGPVALLFFLPPILVFGLSQKDSSVLRGLISGRGWLLFGVVALPWYLFISFSLGSGSVGTVVQEDIVQKLFGFSDADPLYNYPLLLLTSFLPWLFVVGYKTRTQTKAQFSVYDYAYFSSAFIVPLLVMSFFSEKHGKYILPIFPFLAAFLGIWLANLFFDPTRRWGNKYFAHLLLGTIALVLGHFLYYSVIEARIYKYRYEAFPPVVSKLQEYSEGFPVYSFKRLHYRLIYYYERPIPVVNKEQVRQMISEGKSFLLVAEDRDWQELEYGNLDILLEYKPFLKRNRSVRILMSSTSTSRTLTSLRMVPAKFTAD